MYECPNCGGNLKFDIPSQKLGCEHCSAKFDPYAVSKEKDAEEDHSFEMTVFRCPQCYGEVYSTDNTIAGFCSFCGASTILSSRLEKGKKMGFIIPFQKTKEECKKQYSKMMRGSFFAPKELKDPKYIDSFRGIYMPYWVYYIRQEGSTALTGVHSYRRGDYDIEEYYLLKMFLEAYYKGISFDASSSFADTISEKVAPFDVKNMKEFAPTFLSGFYADTSDVDSSIYEDEAREFAVKGTKKFISKDKKVAKYTLKDEDSELEQKFHTKTASIDTALFPVWFLSYRNKDRIAYATVNGQTGKVVADLPVDLKKYMGASFVLALVLFVLLNQFLTLPPVILMPLVSFLALFAAILHTTEMRELAIKESYEDDQGAMAALARKQFQREEKRKKAMQAGAGGMSGVNAADSAMSDNDMMGQLLDNMAATEETMRQETVEITQELLDSLKGDKKKKRKYRTGSLITDVITMILVIQCVPFIAGASSMSSWFSSSVGQMIMIGIALIGTGIATWKSFTYINKVSAKSGMSRSVLCVLTLILAMVIAMIHPASDLFYYGGVVLIMASVFAVLVDLIVSYNILATRQLPQFEYKGGDDRA